MSFFTLRKHCNWIFTVLLLLKSSYRFKYFIRIVNGISSSTSEDVSSVEESIFENYICASWYIRGINEYFPLFPGIIYNNFDRQVFGTKENQRLH